MKLMLEIKDAPTGNVEFTMRVTESPKSQREIKYMHAMIALMREQVPIIGKELGAVAAITSDPNARTTNQ